MVDYIAHINETTQEIQTIKEHSENTACLCRDYSIPIFENMMFNMGLLHDIGKYQQTFQKKINGANVQIEHSICGAMAARENYAGALGVMMGYCIAGHHSGIPDGGFPNDTPDQSTLQGRLKRQTEDYSAYKEELSELEIDVKAFQKLLLQDCGSNVELFVDKFAFFTRYSFSCLTDADSIDTGRFCNIMQPRPLKADFQCCLERLDQKLASFICKTDLQKARALLQEQVFRQKQTDAELYLMNMPTGSGKTLCGAKFGIERVLQGHKKRLIYIIPYNSIIDQTAEIFEELFAGCAEILRHQSTFSYEDSDRDYSEDYRRAVKSASENWDAPFIITTAVQFFESVYSNRRGKLRKLHNLADSILIFDEAHLMPQNYLQPCLRAIAYITRYLNSEAVFLTATMPDYSRLMRQYALPDSNVLNLVNASPLFDEFQKCQYRFLGEITGEALLEMAGQYPSSLIIVNKKREARELYRKCRGEKYHLSTYMAPYDRKRTIRTIKQRLQAMEQEFPDGRDIPRERRITIISTSLIEAGVDLDAHSVFRELTGLDSVLQAGGRCNREGLRTEAVTFVFEYEDEGKKASGDERANITRELFRKYPKISCPQSIAEYYERLFFLKEEDIQKNVITRECHDISSIPFKSYAEGFELIDSHTVSIVVPRDKKSRELVEALRFTGYAAVRELQNYACSVSIPEWEDLVRQHAADDFRTGVYCLVNPDYYDEETGISFEATDYYL